MDDAERYYRVLELEIGATQDQIKQAYRDLAQVWHPDRFAASTRLQDRALEKMKEINEAYEFLKSYEPPRTGTATPQPGTYSRPNTYSEPTRTSSRAPTEGKPEVWCMRGHTALVSSVAFSPSSKLIASGGYDKTVRIWQVGTGLEKLWFLGHSAAVTGVCYGPDNRAVLSGGMDNVLMLRDSESRKELQYCYSGAVIQCVAMSPDGRYAASGTVNAGTQLWDLKTGRELRRFGAREFVNSVAFSPRGTHVAAATSDGDVFLYDRLDGRLSHSFRVVREGVGQMVEALRFSRDGGYLLTASQRQVQIWHLGTGRETGRMEVGSNTLTSADLMPSGAAIVAGHTDGTVRIWSLNTGTDVRVYKGHTEAVKTVACSPDGQLIASGGMDKTVRVWRVFPESGI